MTPYELEICLWYYCRGEDWPCRGEIAISTIDSFVKDGLLETPGKWGMRYKATDRLRAFVEHLENQPLPVQKWVMP